MSDASQHGAVSCSSVAGRPAASSCRPKPTKPLPLPFLLFYLLQHPYCMICVLPPPSLLHHPSIHSSIHWLGSGFIISLVTLVSALALPYNAARATQQQHCPSPPPFKRTPFSTMHPSPSLLHLLLHLHLHLPLAPPRRSAPAALPLSTAISFLNEAPPLDASLISCDRPPHPTHTSHRGQRLLMRSRRPCTLPSAPPPPA